MKYSKEYILRRAFDVFLNKGYDSTSISVLQEELGMSRGAMYRYYKNKEELFISVIDEYVFKIFDKLLQDINYEYTIPQMIEDNYRRTKYLLAAFMKAGVTHTIFLNYTALMIQAAKYYPDFLTRFKQIRSKILFCWKKAVENSIRVGGVRPNVDVNIMSVLFCNVSHEESSGDSFDDTKFTINIMKDMESRKKILYYLYSLIKI